jgi:hypothetical protein
MLIGVIILLNELMSRVNWKKTDLSSRNNCF